MAYANPLRDPRDRCDPGRQVPLFRPVAAVMRRPQPSLPASAPVTIGGGFSPSALDVARDELAGALAHLREVWGAYRAACGHLGEANRRVMPHQTPAFILAALTRAGGSVRPVMFSPERMRERRADAFRRINQTRAMLRAADRRLAAARAALAVLVGED